MTRVERPWPKTSLQEPVGFQVIVRVFCVYAVSMGMKSVKVQCILLLHHPYESASRAFVEALVHPVCPSTAEAPYLEQQGFGN